MALRSPMSHRSFPRHCPVPNRPWTLATPQPNHPRRHLCNHLKNDHPSIPTNDYLTTAFCTQTNIYPCRQCNTPDRIYHDNAHLKAHTNDKHSREKTNLQLVTTTLCNLPCEFHSAWSHSLESLYNWDPTPPPFRATIWHALSPQAKTEYHNILGMVTTWTCYNSF